MELSVMVKPFVTHADGGPAAAGTPSSMHNPAAAGTAKRVHSPAAAGTAKKAFAAAIDA